MTRGQTLIFYAISAIGIVAAIVIWRQRQRVHRIVPIVMSKAADPSMEPVADFPPKPKWKPTVPVDIERTVASFAHYTDRSRTFVVFEHGTCVVVPESSTDPEGEAKRLLDAVYNFHPDFNPRQMDDGNFTVSYSQPAFSVVFADEVKANRQYIDLNHLDGVVREEVLLDASGRQNQFDDRGKIGLFGRARMFMDAQSPRIVRVWRPPGP
jgi:hypothetical protein